VGKCAGWGEAGESEKKRSMSKGVQAKKSWIPGIRALSQFVPGLDVKKGNFGKESK